MNVRLLIVAATLAASSARATDVGVSVSVGQSGVYGRIEVGNGPPPQVVYQQPVIVQPPPVAVAVERPPVYLRVPPGHAKHWKKHCREYNACGERVYFVQERWYNEVYVPSQRAPEHPEHGHGHGHDREDDQGHDHDRDHDRGKREG
jgi:hypothetical protein